MSPVVDLLAAAARAGHTVLPPEAVLRTCSRDDVRAAVSAGSVVEVEWRGAPALALADVAESEELLADGLAALAEENRLAVVVGPDAEGRQRALGAALGAGVPSVVLDDAHLAGVDEVLAAVEDLPEQAVLALALDPALPVGQVLGTVALDVAASGACPVLRAEGGPPRTVLDRARADVAAGRLPTTAPDDRSFVDVPVEGPDEALRRVVQLVSSSIPRAFGATGGDVAVLLAPGSLEADVVGRTLAAEGVSGTDVRCLDGPLPRAWAAVVVVLPGPPAPGVTRALVYAGLRAGTAHASLVRGQGAADLEALLAGTSDRPRRTRLAELLTDAAPG